jgi:hypothetical protein
MLRPILLGGFVLLAIPALAQTTDKAGGSPVQSGTPTTTNDHDPTTDDEAAGTINPTVSTQVNSGTTSAAAGVGVGTQGRTTTHQGIDHGTMTHQGQAAVSGTGTVNATTGAGTVAATVVSAQPRNYPMCSRTITDSCMQVEGRRRPRR